MNVTSQQGGGRHLLARACATAWLVVDAAAQRVPRPAAAGPRRRRLDRSRRSTAASWCGRGVFYESGGGTSLFMTGGFIAENRDGGTLDGRRCARRQCRSRKRSIRAAATSARSARWVTGGGQVVTVRGSWSRHRAASRLRRRVERGARARGFGEGSMTGAQRRAHLGAGRRLPAGSVRTRGTSCGSTTPSGAGALRAGRDPPRARGRRCRPARAWTCTASTARSRVRVCRCSCAPADAWTTRLSAGRRLVRADAVHRGDRRDRTRRGSRRSPGSRPSARGTVVERPHVDCAGRSK